MTWHPLKGQNPDASKKLKKGLDFQTFLAKVKNRDHEPFDRRQSFGFDNLAAAAVGPERVHTNGGCSSLSGQGS
jgi:hypothetical protein